MKKDKYHKSIPGRVKTLIVDCGMLNRRGKIAWERIAKTLGVSISTLRRWRDPLSEYYHKSFVKAVTEAQEAIDAGSIKRSMIEKARGFTQIKVTKEPKLVGPSRPPLSSMNKPELIKCGRKLKFKKIEKMTTSQLILAIDEALEKATELVMAVTKKETTTMAGDVQAAKLALGNIGPEDERWKEKTEMEHTGVVGVNFNIKKNYDSDKKKN